MALVRYPGFLIPLVLVVLASGVAGAQSGGSSSDRVDSTYTIAFSRLDMLTLEIDAHVFRIQLDDGQYTVSGMRDRYDALRSGAGQAAADEFVRRIESKLNETAKSTLASAFPDATSRQVTRIDLDDATIQKSSPSPTVNYLIRAAVTLDREPLGLGTLTDAQVDAAFEAGALLRTDIHLSAAPGYKTTYAISPPPGLAFSSPSVGSVGADGSRFSHVLDNSAGAAVRKATATLTLADPAAERATREDIRTSIALEVPNLRVAAERLAVEARMDVELVSLSVGERFAGAVPAKVDLPFVSADGLRALRAAGLVTDSQLESAEEEILADAGEALTSSLGAGAKPSGGFVAESLAAGAPDGTPVRFRATATGGFAVPAADLADGTDVTGLFMAGAAIDTSFTLESPERRATTVVLTLPEAVEFASATEGGVVSADGHSVSWTVDNSAGATRKALPVSVRIHDAQAPTFTAAKSKIEVVVDIRDVDISATKAAGGDFGNLLIDVAVRGDLGVIEIPEDIKQKLPASVKLDYLSSDAIRILYRDGIIAEKELADLEATLQSEVKSRIASALGGAAPDVQGGLDRASLAPALVSSPVSGDKPIVFQVTLSMSKPLVGGAATPAGAIALYTMSQSFDLPRVQGLDTTYKVILPKGLAVVDASATGGDVVQGEEDGRAYFTVTPTGDEAAKTTVAMAVTPTFVAIKFWPVILLVVVLLAIIIAGPIILVVRRRRAKAAAKGAPEPGAGALAPGAGKK